MERLINYMTKQLSTTSLPRRLDKLSKEEREKLFQPKNAYQRAKRDRIFRESYESEWIRWKLIREHTWRELGKLNSSFVHFECVDCG